MSPKAYPPSQHVLDKKPHVSSWEQYQQMHKASVDDPAKFWSEQAKNFYWKKMWSEDNVFSCNMDVTKGEIFHKWFEGATTNVAYNALDRHVEAGKGDKVAFYWEGNDGVNRTHTYNDMFKMVKKMANVLKQMGVKKGDVVTLYLPMIPLVVAAAHACSRIGALHSIVFGGFSSKNLAFRLMDAKSRIIVTADGVRRGDKLIPLKATVDEAIAMCKKENWEVNHALVTKRLNNDIDWNPLVDANLDELFAEASEECEVEWCNAEDGLFMIYTSGSTGKPKGIVHSTGGVQVYAGRTFYYTFDYHDDEVYFNTADAAWITGIIYTIMGPMLNCATQVMFEGIPTWPQPDRFWKLIEKFKVNLFYTAPTAIRVLKSADDKYVKNCDLSSLRVLGTVGEPINETAWEWYYKEVGNSRCSISDTYWLSETAGHIITPLPGCTTLVPSSATYPMFGIDAIIVDEDGNEIKGEGKGFFCIRQSWPGVTRTIWGNHMRYEKGYFSRFPGHFMTGDLASRDSEGRFIIEGRADDQLNVSGHRLSTAEIEGAINSHSAVSECAVVPVPHDIKGQSVFAFIVLGDDNNGSEDLKKEIVDYVAQQIGKIAKPDVIHWAPGLPKTRSGKIMRRILKKIAVGEKDYGDLSTLTDSSVVEKLEESSQKQ